MRNLSTLGISANKRVKFEEFYKYKVQININRNCCAWNSLYKKLKSNCVVLHVESDQVQWYYHYLIPYVHYIPVQKDLSDIYEKIEFVFNNDDLCKQIAINACNLMNIISSQYVN